MNHIVATRNNFGAAGESANMMASVAVVAFNRIGMGFSYNMAFLWQNCGKSIPSISIKGTIF